MRRGESEGFLRVSISCDEEEALNTIERMYIHTNNECARQLELSIKDSYKRLLKPSIENEFAISSKQNADIEAIKIFSKNLQQLLLSPPLGQKIVMGIDPGYRTGCKVVCLNREGDFMVNTTIYPHPPQNSIDEAKQIILSLCQKYKIEIIVIGNGTAGRETEQFVKSIGLPIEIEIYNISEDGASVYSASKSAREEFPDFDVTVRGAISIARRAQDPLSELVKIDPKSIGVGQYQHDMDQNRLNDTLSGVIEDCVNEVGVNLNNASVSLLKYVSGISLPLANNIYDYLKTEGRFNSRFDLLKVKKMGPKSFEQCAGFLRIYEGSEPLDTTNIHPESYKVAKRILNECNIDLLHDSTLEKTSKIAKINISSFIKEENITFDLFNELKKEIIKPTRDIREEAKVAKI